MTKPPRRVDVIAQAFAQRLLTEVQAHVQQRAGFWLECVVAEMFPGESVDLYGAKIPVTQRAERQARIAAALAAGASPAEVARTERITERHARRIRGRVGGGSGGHSPP